jgi:flagellar hook assembly protein FlgD
MTSLSAGGKYYYFQDWSIDGQRIFYTYDNHIYSQNILTAEEIKITTNSAAYDNVRISPDGMKMLYKKGSQNIYKANLDGCNEELVSSSKAFACWKPNGEIYLGDKALIWSPFVSNMASLSITEISEKISTSLEALSPKNGETIKTIRPTFKWYGLTGVQKYKIECTKPGISQRDLTKTFSSSEVSSTRPALSYTIHEFDEGLQKSNNDLDFWNWKIKAYDASDVVTAESTSNNFLIIPDLTLEEVVNYPNPFNPKRETTKIRYRLSRDAEWVKIRIYDITGALVRELDGKTNCEGMGIWDKYNDVDWDGLNGRGDMVLNGVYPFEVIAKLGDRTVSGRGKIAVLK